MQNLKTIGLALITAFALSAMTASAASADTAEVTGSPEVLGHDAGGPHALTTVFGHECGAATYPGTVEGSTITLGLEFSNCVTSMGWITTVTDYGCQYTLTLGTLDEDSAPAIAALTECDEGSQVLLHLYEDKAEVFDICTFEFPEQFNLGGLVVTDQANGYLLIEGTISGITNYVAGSCATKATGGKSDTINVGAAQLHVSITLEGIEGELSLE